MEDLIRYWIEKHIQFVDVSFSCEGEMLTDIQPLICQINDPKEGIKEKFPFKILNDEICQKVIDEVRDNVKFRICYEYEYRGEFGYVRMMLNYDSSGFIFIKESNEEYHREYIEQVEIPISKEEAEVLSKNVSFLQKAPNVEDTDIKFKGDLVISDNDLKIIESISNKLLKFAINYPYKVKDINAKMIEDWIIYDTESDGDGVAINYNGDGIYLPVILEATFEEHEKVKTIY